MGKCSTVVSGVASSCAGSDVSTCASSCAGSDVSTCASSCAGSDVSTCASSCAGSDVSTCASSCAGLSPSGAGGGVYFSSFLISALHVLVLNSKCTSSCNLFTTASTCAGSSVINLLDVFSITCTPSCFSTYRSIESGAVFWYVMFTPAVLVSRVAFLKGSLLQALQILLYRFCIARLYIASFVVVLRCCVSASSTASTSVILAN